MTNLLHFNQTTQFNYKISPLKLVPSHITPPPHITSANYKPSNSISIIKTQDELDKLRYAGQIAGKVLSTAIEAIKSKLCSSGDEVDELVHNEIIKHNCYPSSLGFMGFPKSLCISPNDSKQST